MYTIGFYCSEDYTSYQEAAACTAVYYVDVTDLSGSGDSLHIAGFRTALEVAQAAFRCAGKTHVHAVLLRDGDIIDTAPVI